MVNKLHRADQPVVNHEHKMALDNRGNALILVWYIETKEFETMIVSHLPFLLYSETPTYVTCFIPMSNGGAYCIIRALELWRKG